MSGSLSTYLETALLNHVFGGPDYVPPAQFYLALLTQSSTADTPGPEVTGTGYARSPITFNPPAGSPPLISNPNAIQYATAATAWGVVTAGAIYDAGSGGNYLGFGQLVSALDGITPAPLNVQPGSIVRIPAMGVVLGFAVPPVSAVLWTHPGAARRLSMRPVIGQVIDGAGVARTGVVMEPRP